MKRKWHQAVLLVTVTVTLTGCSVLTEIERLGQNVQTSVTQKDPVIEKELQDLQEQVANYFYYQQLDTDEERRVYLQLANGMRKFAEEIAIDPVTDEVYTRAYFSVANDFPEYFWMTDAMEDGISYDDLSQPTYPERVEETSKELASIATTIVQQAPTENTYETVKYFYEYIIQQTDYNLAALNDTQLSWDNQSITSVLLNKSSVCAGYSRTFQYLCKLAGIESIFVTGKVTGQNEETIEHAWNLVKIGQTYYGVDTTWGDPVFDEAMGSQTQADISYDYLCVPDFIMERSRVADNDLLSYWGNDYIYTERPLTYPSYTDNSLNYYVRQGTYFESFDEPTIIETISHQHQLGHNRLVLQFSNAEAMNQMVAYAGFPDSRIFEALAVVDTYQYLYNDQNFTVELIAQ